MDSLKVCIDCGQLGTGTRCDSCKAALDRRIEDRRGGRAARGYGNAWQRTAAKVKRLNPTCVVCGTTEDLTVDHVLPKARGGTDEPDNLATMCRYHNSAKGSQ